MWGCILSGGASRLCKRLSIAEGSSIGSYERGYVDKLWTFCRIIETYAANTML